MDTELVKYSAWLSAAVLGYSTLKKLQEGHCWLATGIWLHTRVVCWQHQPRPRVSYCTLLWNRKVYWVSPDPSFLQRGGSRLLCLGGRSPGGIHVQQWLCVCVCVCVPHSNGVISSSLDCCTSLCLYMWLSVYLHLLAPLWYYLCQFLPLPQVNLCCLYYGECSFSCCI